jgi:hypothetical protein
MRQTVQASIVVPTIFSVMLRRRFTNTETWVLILENNWISLTTTKANGELFETARAERKKRSNLSTPEHAPFRMDTDDNVFASSTSVL